MQRQSALFRLQELTQEQWGLVTRQQVREAGIGTTTLERMIAPGGSLDRVATGVYRLVVAPIPDHLDLRAAWLQLAPGVPAWERTAEQGIVSHRSAAAVYGLAHFPADRHEFTVPKRKQTGRPDVRIHLRLIEDRERAILRGLPVTRPSRIASDLLWDHEDPEGIAQLIADAIRLAYEDPGTFADSLAPHAARFGLPKGAGLELLGWFLDLANDPQKERRLDEARAHVDRAAGMKT
ncbi:MAG: type IV toxin-antitoxin system AbiEi family antitoxin domain-containing protein [Streptosporangiaceae bacterium]